MKLSTALAAGALGAALAAAAVFIFVDVYRSESCFVESGPGGALRCVSGSSTLVEKNGAWVLALIGLPVALSAVVFVSATGLLPLPRSAGWAALVVLLAGCLITGFSIGLLFFPAALLALAAMLLSKPRLRDERA